MSLFWRKFLAFLTLTSFLWLSVITPAKAFLPLIALAVEAAASDVAFSTALGLSTAAIGSAIAFIKFRDPNNSGTVLTVQIDPSAKLETPGGWSPPTITIYPNAPTGIAATKSYTNNQVGATSYLSFSDARQGAITNEINSSAGNLASCSWTAGTDNGTNQTITGSGTTVNGFGSCAVSFIVYAPTYSCPVGYTLSSQTCNVSNNAIVKKPALNRHMMTRVGNTFVKDTQQNVADDLAGNTSAFSAPGTGILTAKNPVTGETTTITINQTDGSTTVVTTKTNADGTTSTRTTTTISAPDTTNNIPPKISGKKVEQLPGVGDAVGAPSTTATPSVSVSVDTSNLATHSDVAAVSSSVDVAKMQAHADADQAHIDAQAMKDKLDALKTGQCGGTAQPACKIDESATPTVFDSSSQQSGLDSQFGTLESTVTGHTTGVGTGLSLPGIFAISAPCVNPSFDASDVRAGAAVTIHACETAASIQPYSRWAAYVLTVFGIYGLWFRKVGGV